MALERQLQQAIRDAVHRPSRKPFSWGGLAGYQQLSAIADGIRQLVDETPETRYLRRLLSQVERALENYQALAKDLTAAHDWLRRVATVLHYPHPAGEASSEKLSSQSVAQAMTALLAAFQPDFKRQPAQVALYHALARTWDACRSDLLHCYAIKGLPPDNLALEAIFSTLRRHQRRISGHKSTGELRVLGHYQVLFQAECKEDLLAQLRTVPLARYRHHRQRIEQAAAPWRFIHRLHRNPDRTIQSLAGAYETHRRQVFQLQTPDRLQNTS
jgi:hypothetical protein